LQDGWQISSCLVKRLRRVLRQEWKVGGLSEL
jgi:hypothetical protein